MRVGSSLTTIGEEAINSCFFSLKNSKKLIHDLKLKQPENDVATSKIQASNICSKIGFPVVIRPSYVLGGRAMEIIHNLDQLDKYITEAVKVSEIVLR